MSEDAKGVGQASKKKTPITFWLLAALVVLCTGAVVVGAFTSDEGTSDPSGDAKRVCQEEFLPKRLKAPATAKFTGVTVSSSGEVYTVIGSVDSENSFGALVRASFSCVVRAEGDQWILQSANING